MPKPHPLPLPSVKCNLIFMTDSPATFFLLLNSHHQIHQMLVIMEQIKQIYPV